MAVLRCKDVQALLQFDAPVGHEVYVLQHHPMPLFVSQVKLLHCHHILPLSHGNVVVVHIGLQLDDLPTKCFHFLHWISARREDEEEGSDVRGILVGGRQDLIEGPRTIALCVVTTVRQYAADPIAKGHGHAVRTQTSNHQKLLEGDQIKSLPIERKFHILGSELVEPLLETVGCILLHVLSNLLETFKFDKLHHHGPSLIGKPLRQRVFNEHCRRSPEQEVEVRFIEFL
mmetsp:Transcript_87508/g.160434  ORF Transcript_87508/g.160434 Transcript_87508/m.160434 type:complete len:230 (+) Transcript_87508:148-837(+)